MHFDFTLPGEIWKDVVGYEGRYLVSNLGRVVSLVPRVVANPYDPQNPRILDRPPTLLKLTCRKNRHNRVFALLSLDNKKRQWPVAHLVLTAFVGPRPTGAQACHFPDRDPRNNRLDNLQWGTLHTNLSHKLLQATDQRDGARQCIRLSHAQLLRIRELYATGRYSYPQLARQFGASVNTIGRVVRRDTWDFVG
jgi:hypothetical protein